MGDPRVFSGDDDSEFRGWLSNHPTGQVVNGLDGTGRQLHRSYSGGAVWHLSTCPSIGGTGTRMGSVKSYTGEFPKACWETRTEVEEWMRREGAPEVWPCPICQPGSSKVQVATSRTPDSPRIRSSTP